MPPPLQIAVAQPCTRAHDVGGNAMRHADAILRANARVVVFPELSLTGYEFDADVVDPDDRRLLPLLEACREAGTVAFAGAPAKGKDGAGRSIGVLRIDAGAVSVVYRKMYLGGTEELVYTPGSTPSVVEVDGWRLGLAVCRDIGIEAHATATAAAGMDVYVSGVLEHERDAEIMAGRARLIAQRHSVWVAIASFAGATGEGFDAAAGRSAVWDPNGQAVVVAGRSCDEFASVTLHSPAM